MLFVHRYSHHFQGYFKFFLKDSSAWSSRKLSSSYLKLKAGYNYFKVVWIMHFVHTVGSHFIIYIKFNMSMDEVNEVSQTSYFSIFVLWTQQLSDKVADVISCKFMSLCIGNFVDICFGLIFIDTCFLSLRNIWISNDPLNAKGRKLIYNGYQLERE